jgi:N-acetyl-anhydromuramyl-L-alanine amidase AmpD
MNAPQFATFEPPILFRRSGHFGSRAGAEIRLIVLHSAECAETPVAAENLASWGGTAQGSWHYAVDNDSITRSVEDHHRAFHAKQVNAYSLGVEQAGKASQTAEQWDDPYSRALLERTAHLLAWLCHRHVIPVEFVSAAEIAAQHPHGGVWGITTHAECSRAFGVAGGHWDPGPNYPLQKVLTRVTEIHEFFGVRK